MKKSLVKAFLAALLCLTLMPFASALALKASGDGVVRRGNFEDSGISFQIPNSFALENINAGKTADIIKFTGPEDVNGFIPKITVKIESAAHDFASITSKQTQEYIEVDLKGSNALNMVDETITGSNGDMMRQVFFYNTEDGRMNILWRYLLNVNGYGVTYEYQAYTATRSLPDDLKVMPDVIKNFTIQ